MVKTGVGLTLNLIQFEKSTSFSRNIYNNEFNK
jgi:hypothetical protein